jgi:hypothetical protein
MYISMPWSAAVRGRGMHNANRRIEMSRLGVGMAVSTAVLTLGLSGVAVGQQSAMTFFVTSTGSGKGADFGGVAGADAHCQKLAAAVGAGNHTWRAYLSASATPTSAVVNARDRIGAGPWQNAKGVVVATSVANLHSDQNNLNKQTALTENGETVKSRGDTPNQHDILTGSQPDGTAVAGTQDTTCGNWTKSGEGSAIVGHSDRTGLDESAAAKSWNSSHPSRGCSDAALISTGGAGYLYCFAAK